MSFFQNAAKPKNDTDVAEEFFGAEALAP